MTSITEEIRKYYQQPDLAAKEWKKSGGKVVGYFCDSVPEELIIAAGLLPVRLNGDPGGDTNIAKKHVIPRYSTRETFVSSMLNRLLSGEYDFLDYLVIPHSRDSIHRLYQLLNMMRESDNLYNLPELHFLDLPHTPFFSSLKYAGDEFHAFKATLENWSGTSITDDNLSEAIQATNKNKLLLQEIKALREDTPSRISGTKALEIIGTSVFIPKTKHNELLTKLLEDVNQLSVDNPTRIFVAGSPLDNPQLYEYIETLDATVVAEDHCWGFRSVENMINTSIAPMDAILDRYFFKPPCHWMFPTSKRIDLLLQNARLAEVDGVINNVFKNDEAVAWEIPEKTQALKDSGFKLLTLRNQPYQFEESDVVKDDIKNFVLSLQK